MTVDRRKAVSTDGKPDLWFDSLDDYIGSGWVLYGSTREKIDVNLDRWKLAGKPHLWVLCETDGDAEFWIDYGWGHSMLSVGDEFDVVPSSEFICRVGRFIGLCTEYWDLPKAIWS